MSESTPQPDGNGAPTPTPPVVVPSPVPPAAPTPDSSSRRFFAEGSGFRSLRDLVLFGFGLGILTQQIFFAETISTLIIALGAGATGLPVVLRTDSRSR